MAQFHDQFGALLKHAAWMNGHLLGQKPECSALSLVGWSAVGPARQFGGDQDVIDPSQRGTGTGGAGHCSLCERCTTTLGPPQGSRAEKIRAKVCSGSVPPFPALNRPKPPCPALN